MKIFDAYEISPCKRHEEPDAPGTFYYEVCEPHEADVWTLYGHIDGQGVQAIGDFGTREHAEETYYRITGALFTGSYEAETRLRVMHAADGLMSGTTTSGLPYTFAEAADEAEAARYTPGPWRHYPARLVDGSLWKSQVQPPETEACSPCAGYGITKVQAEANGCLIATAPELLDALEGLLSERLRPERGLPFTERDVLRIQSAERKARNIIAKAKGE